MSYGHARRKRVKRSLHGHAAVPLVCVQCSRHTHLVRDTQVSHSAQRQLSERMYVCHCCVLPLHALLFSHYFDHSFRFFLNLQSMCSKDGQITGFYCLAELFLNQNFSPPATEWTKYRTAVPHTAFAKRFGNTEEAHMSVRVNPALRVYRDGQYHPTWWFLKQKSLPIMNSKIKINSKISYFENHIFKSLLNYEFLLYIIISFE